MHFNFNNSLLTALWLEAVIHITISISLGLTLRQRISSRSTDGLPARVVLVVLRTASYTAVFSLAAGTLLYSSGDLANLFRHQLTFSFSPSFSSPPCPSTTSCNRLLLWCPRRTLLHSILRLLGTASRPLRPQPLHYPFPSSKHRRLP
jgi:hypothetical protein